MHGAWGMMRWLSATPIIFSRFLNERISVYTIATKFEGEARGMKG
jgi:hypothetical protein